MHYGVKMGSNTQMKPQIEETLSCEPSILLGSHNFHNFC